MFERARLRAADPMRVALIERWCAVAWRLPEDDRLPALASLITPTAGAAALARALGSPVTDRGLSARVLGYVPRRRAVVRFDGAVSLIAKLGRMRDEGDCHRRQVELFRHPNRGFRLPRPLGYDPVLGFRVEEAVSGASIEPLLQYAVLDDLLRDAATAIVALHGTPPPQGLPRIGSGDLLAQIEDKTIGRLTTTLPGLAPRIMDLSARLRARGPSRDLALDVTLHGDFHPANLLVDDDGPVVIDLDNLATGPTERDLAIFAGRVILLGLKDGSRADEIVAAALRFPEHYVASGGCPVSDATFGWYVAATVLAKQISNGVRRLAPGLSSLAAGLLDLAEEGLT